MKTLTVTFALTVILAGMSGCTGVEEFGLLSSRNVPPETFSRLGKSGQPVTGEASHGWFLIIFSGDMPADQTAVDNAINKGPRGTVALADGTIERKETNLIFFGTTWARVTGTPVVDSKLAAE